MEQNKDLSKIADATELIIALKLNGVQLNYGINSNVPISVSFQQKGRGNGCLLNPLLNSIDQNKWNTIQINRP